MNLVKIKRLLYILILICYLFYGIILLSELEQSNIEQLCNRVTYFAK